MKSATQTVGVACNAAQLAQLTVASWTIGTLRVRRPYGFLLSEGEG
jgi:hypothetical protein